MRFLVLVSLLGCTGTPPPASTDEPTTTPSGLLPTVPSSAAELRAAPWKSAWKSDDHRVVNAGTGRLLSAHGTVEVGEGAPCGSAQRHAEPGVLWLPPGPPITHGQAPMVTAAVVERAAWRLAEVIGPRIGIQPGVEAPDPALHQGIRVRSVRKVRRQGPPFQIVVGERGADVIVAVTDREAETLQSGAVLRRSTDVPMELGQVPPADIDGEPGTELVVYGDHSTSSFRAVLAVDLMTGRLTVRTFEEGTAPACP